MVLFSTILCAIFLATCSLCIWYWRFSRRHTKEDVHSVNENMIALATIFSSIAAIAVSVFTARITWEQKENEKAQVMMQRKEHQPVFQVIHEFQDDAATQKKNVSEDLLIDNYGERVQSFDKIHEHSYIEFKYVNLENGTTEITSYMPVQYYDIAYSTYNIQGLIYYAQPSKMKQNRLIYSDLVYEASKFSSDSFYESVEVKLITLIRIDYTDMYGEANTVFLDNNKIIGEEEYNKVRTAADEEYKAPFNVADLNLDLFWKNCKRVQLIRAK